MNLLVHKNRFFNFFENTNSENLGFYFSFFFHIIILIFAIGLPSFFDPKPINIPTIIPIEIVNVSNVTSIPKEIKETKSAEMKQATVKEKKFNSSNNQEIKKIEVKNKPQIKNKIEKKLTPKKDTIITQKKDIIIDEKKQTSLNLKKDIIIDEKKQTSLNLKKDKIRIEKKNVESLPSKKIKPKLKPKPNLDIKKQEQNTDVIPKVKVKAKPTLKAKMDISAEVKTKPTLKAKMDISAEVKTKPDQNSEFNIATMLKDLRNEKSISKNVNKTETTKQEKNKITQPLNKISKEKAQLSISEIDLLRQQLSSCWNAPAGAVIEKGMLVKISAKLKPNRRVYDNSVRIVDTNIPKSNSFYGPITESAMRTLLNPECIPLKLPEDQYNLWKNLTITFDYSIMKGY
jgi:hypothetical protein